MSDHLADISLDEISGMLLPSDLTTLSPSSMAEAEEQLALYGKSLNLIIEAVSQTSPNPERDITILKNRYGLNASSEPKSFLAISKILNLSREYTRQMTKRIWRRLQKIGYDINEAKLRQLLESIRELEKLTGTLVEFKD